VEWRWWRGVVLIELQKDCQWQEIIQFFPFKKQAGTFCVTEIVWLGQVCMKFQLVILCLFLKEDVNLDKFRCLPIFFNPWITEQKPSYCNGTAHILYTYFLNYFLKIFFQGSINRPNCSQNVAFIQISHFSWNYIEWNT